MRAAFVIGAVALLVLCTSLSLWGQHARLVLVAQVFCALVGGALLTWASSVQRSAHAIVATVLAGTSLLLFTQWAALWWFGAVASNELRIVRLTFCVAAIAAFVTWVLAEARSLRRSRHTGFVDERTVTLVGKLTGGGNWSRLLVFEVLNLVYLLAPKHRLEEELSSPETTTFLYLKQGENTQTHIAVIVLGGIEAAVMHAIIALWSPVAAWLVSAVSCYMLIAILANLRSLRLRPIVLDGKSLLIRNGLWYGARIELVNVRAIAMLPRSAAREHTGISMKGLGAVNCVLHTDIPVEVVLPLRRLVTSRTVLFGVDEPGRLIALVRGSLGASGVLIE